MDIDLRASFGSGFEPGFCGRRVFVGWSARWGALAGSVVRCGAFVMVKRLSAAS